MAAEQPDQPPVAPVLTVLGDGCWRHVFEALHKDADGLDNSIGQLAQSCKALQQTVQHWRQMLCIELRDVAASKAAGHCLSRLHSCNQLRLRMVAEPDHWLRVGAFCHAADGPSLAHVREFAVEGGRLDVATALLIGKTLRNVSIVTICHHLRDGSPSLCQTPEGQGEAVACLAHCWPGLQHLSCDWETTLSKPVLDAITSLTSLQSLVLAAHGTTGQDRHASNVNVLSALTGLTRLTLNLKPEVYPRDWGWLRNMPHLCELSALGSNSSLVSLSTEMAEALSVLPSLKSLRVDAFALRPTVVNGLSKWRLPALRTLRHNLKYIDVLTAARLAARCPCMVHAPSLLVVLHAPSMDNREQLAGKLRALRALGAHGWFNGGGGKLLVQNLNANLQQLVEAPRAAAGEHTAPLLPRLQHLQVRAAISRPHMDWLVAQVPALRCVECGYGMVPALSGLPCLERIGLWKPDDDGGTVAPTAAEVCQALSELRVPPGRTVRVFRASQLLEAVELGIAAACLKVHGLCLEP